MFDATVRVTLPVPGRLSPALGSVEITVPSFCPFCAAVSAISTVTPGSACLASSCVLPTRSGMVEGRVADAVVDEDGEALGVEVSDGSASGVGGSATGVSVATASTGAALSGFRYFSAATPPAASSTRTSRTTTRTRPFLRFFFFGTGTTPTFRSIAGVPGCGTGAAPPTPGTV